MRSRSTMIKLVLLAFLLASVLVGPSLSPATAAQKKAAKGKNVEQVHAQKSRGGGPDENIKQDRQPNDPNKPAPAPPNKGGEKPKGGTGYCKVIVDNHTGWNIDIYVDGTWRGTLGAWDDDYAYTGSGATKLYAVATFTDGSRLTWGPSIVNCYGSYVWQLYP